MKKSFNLLFSATALLTVLLTSCGTTPSPTTTATPTPTTSTSTATSSTMTFPDGYERDSGLGKTNYKTTKSDEYKVTLEDELVGEGTPCLASKGEQNLLVIPVEFSDFPAESLMPSITDATEAKAKAKQFIQDAFFGETEDTGWESLKSYYYKSSYGKLTLNGFVTDWFMLDKSVKDLLEYWKTVPSSEGGNGGYNSTWYILREAVKWYKSVSSEKGWPDIKEFDKNSDGMIDGVWLVNSAGIKAYSSDDFWAFTYWDLNNPDVKVNYDPENPMAVPYCSASYKFLENAGYNGKPDCHTMIHETGHLMGIEDYYTYDKGGWGPAGGGDMMDQNVGDHDSFTKTLYGWTNPYYVTGDAEITLKPFQENGDCIIVKNGWNGHAFDEYLILEFYTPTGLNEKDASEVYKGEKDGYPQLPSKNGIKIYHIDARLGMFDRSTVNQSKQQALIGYTDEMTTEYNGKKVVTFMAHSNTRSRSAEPNNSLIHLLESTGRNSFKDNGNKISNTTLFKEGALFGANKKFVDFKFNDGTSLDYVIEIKSVTDSSATIVFNAKKA